MKPKAWEDIIADLESNATRGNHSECRRILNTLNPRKIPRKWCSSIAEVAFRVNSSIFALKVLQPHIYPETPLATKASDKEKIIYSTALSSLGAIQEALEILDCIDPKTEPEALFYRASANNYLWNYQESTELLRAFIDSNTISSYRKLVGQVNLASAYIHTFDWIAAKALLVEIQKECELNGYQLLLGNCLELTAQVHIFQGDFDQATELLKKAMSHLEKQGGLYSLYVEKWEIINQGMKAKQLNQKIDLTAAFQILRQKALTIGHWNTLRECDLFEAILTDNQYLFKKVIVGTPFKHYRQRAKKLQGTQLNTVSQFQWQLGSEKVRSLQVFDPYRKQDQIEALYEKPLLLALYDALTQDFYQPCTIGQLFQTIYPSEKLNPFSSPQRVLQLLRRLNDWFETNQVSLEVEFKKSEFRFCSPQGISIMVRRGKRLSSFDGILFDLKNHFGDEGFSVPQAVEFTKTSAATAEKILRKAYSENLLIRDRKKSGLNYRFAPLQRKRKGAA